MYVLHPKFAKEPEHYVRAFALIQKDLHELFDYIEPSDVNLECYSYRIHELHMRTCIEIEANCRAILIENDYPKTKNLVMDDYRKLESTHRLSSYDVMLPVWRGIRNQWQPFAAWRSNGVLTWYQAYNAAKHDRHDQFPKANFRNLLDSICGLVVLLSAQFHTWDFSPASPTLALGGFGGPPKGFELAIGGYFLVRFPTDWPQEGQYDFDWQSLKSEQDPFQTLQF